MIGYIGDFYNSMAYPDNVAQVTDAMMKISSKDPFLQSLVYQVVSCRLAHCHQFKLEA